MTKYCFLICFLSLFGLSLGLWSKGIVHYAINAKDYDLHSQEIILDVLNDIQKEICIKFFDTPPDYVATVENKILHINNPDKRKICTPDIYNYTGSVVDMVIGYKCLNRKEVIRIVVDMLRASVEQTAGETELILTIADTINSHDLLKKFKDHEAAHYTTMLTPADRNFINAHYHTECDASVPQLVARRHGGGGTGDGDMDVMSPENEEYYKKKRWPLGIVMYGFEKELRNSPQASEIRRAMGLIEFESCVVFQEVEDSDSINPRSLLYFASSGADAPQLGFMEGNQTICIDEMTIGAAGHSAHILNNLMRALGLPMQSNRHDRDYYISVNWNNVEKGKEHYLEKTPKAASIRDSPFGYDYDSVTHAPANYMCRERACAAGEATVLPAQDHLWQRTMSMGHRVELSVADRDTLSLIYNQACSDRYSTHNRDY